MSAVDVLVVGGGVTGAGVARDAALRGLRVLLVEQRDLASGTTWGSSGMIHGGVRYLEHDWETTRVSCLDGGYIRRIAPHLLFPVVFLVPVFPDAKMSIETAEVGLEAYDHFQPLKGARAHVRLTGAEALALEPGLPANVVGALTMEEWGVDPSRLVTLTALDARDAGAEIRTWTEVVGLECEGARVVGARLRPRDGGAVETVRADVVVNAAGPWAGELAAMAGATVRLRPAKGIHLVYDRRICNVALTTEAVDGRGLLLVPHASTTILGTTDDDFYGDPEHLDVTEDEVEYVLEAAERVLPSIRRHRIAHATAAVRPTLYERRRYEDDLSREYEVFDHAVLDGVPGLLSIAGGKMSMFRKMAEDTVDAVERVLGRPHVPCTTHLRPLPGGASAVSVADVAGEFGLALPVANRLASRHGDRAVDLLRAAAPAERAAVLCECEPVTVAELRHSIRHESVVRLEDLYRRVRWSGGACLGMRCCWEAARVMGEEHGWSQRRVEEEVHDFLDARWRDRPTVMDGPGLAQEELARGALCSAGAPGATLDLATGAAPAPTVAR